MAEDGSPVFDVTALGEAEQGFWRGLWDTACEDAVLELGIEMAEFDQLTAATVAGEGDRPVLNFVLGAGRAGTVSDGCLAAAVEWLECHDVSFRVPLVAGLPEFDDADAWLKQRRFRLFEGPPKLVRDGSPPGSAFPQGIDLYERVDPLEDESFGDALAESLGLVDWASTFFFDLPGKADWRCYCSAHRDEPLAYVAMRISDGIATLVLASRPTGELEGLGQHAVLHRAITDASKAGCRTMTVAEAGSEPAVSDRKSLIEAGFAPSFPTFTWQAGARVPS